MPPHTSCLEVALQLLNTHLLRVSNQSQLDCRCLYIARSHHHPPRPSHEHRYLFWTPHYEPYKMYWVHIHASAADHIMSPYGQSMHTYLGNAMSLLNRLITIGCELDVSTCRDYFLLCGVVWVLNHHLDLASAAGHDQTQFQPPCIHTSLPMLDYLIGCSACLIRVSPWLTCMSSTPF